MVDDSAQLLRPMMPELNVLRGCACLAVLAWHGLSVYTREGAMGVEGAIHTITSGGHYGVNLFFVLSGLLITNILLNERERPDYFVRFYKRRALRILPAYYSMLILLALYGLPPAFLGLSFLHVANMVPLLGVPMAYGPFWSLAVEEQFYALWPQLVRRIRVRSLVAMLLAVIPLSISLDWQMGETRWAWMTLPYSLHGLAIGALLAVYLRSASRRGACWLTVGVASCGVLGLLWLRGPVGRQIGWECVFAAGIVAALLAGTSGLEAWTRPRWLLFFGEISYGLYLVHVLVFAMYRRLVFVNGDLSSTLRQFVVCSAVSIALATASRFSMEAWFLSLKDKPLKRYVTTAYAACRTRFA